MYVVLLLVQHEGLPTDLDTSSVSIYSFQRNNRTIHLVDTPGFDDTHRSESSVLQEIVYWLDAAYAPNAVEDQRGFLLDGIIYLHDISTPRWSGSSRRSLDILKAISGEDNFDAIALVSTFWDRAEQIKGIEGEQQLRNSDRMWRPLLDRGSISFRQDAGYRSAIRIVDFIASRNKKYVLQIQRELAVPEATLIETTAGREASRLWSDEIQEFKMALGESRAELKKNLQDRNTASDLEAEISDFQNRIIQVERDVTDLSMQKLSLHRTWTERNNKQITELDKQIDDCDVEIDSLKSKLQQRHGGVNNLSMVSLNQFGGSADPEALAIKEARQRKKDLQAARQHKITTRSMYAGMVGTTFGGLSVSLALLPLVAPLCSVM